VIPLGCDIESRSKNWTLNVNVYTVAQQRRSEFNQTCKTQQQQTTKEVKEFLCSVSQKKGEKKLLIGFFFFSFFFDFFLPLAAQT
jgi:predicted O-linked N-acetylglucosamine transferase (SPINDLY family)